MYVNLKDVIGLLVVAWRVMAIITLILSIVFLLIAVGTNWRMFRRASLNCFAAGILIFADAELMGICYNIRWLLAIKIAVSAILLAVGLLLKAGLWSQKLKAEIADQNHAKKLQVEQYYWFIPLTDRLAIAGIVQLCIEILFWFICKV